MELSFGGAEGEYEEGGSYEEEVEQEGQAAATPAAELGGAAAGSLAAAPATHPAGNAQAPVLQPEVRAGLRESGSGAQAATMLPHG